MPSKSKNVFMDRVEYEICNDHRCTVQIIILFTAHSILKIEVTSVKAETRKHLELLFAKNLDVIETMNKLDRYPVTIDSRMLKFRYRKTIISKDHNLQSLQPQKLQPLKIDTSKIKGIEEVCNLQDHMLQRS